MYIQIYTDYVPKSGTARGDQGRRKEGKIVNNNEIYHICVGIRPRKHTENCQTTQHRGKRLRKLRGGGCIDLSTMHIQVQ
jgi:hypothetical protein